MHTVTLNDRVKVPEAVVYQKVGEDIVLLNFETGFYYGLDAVGSRLWELLAEHGSLRKVFEVMAGEYEVVPDELREDMLRLVQDLRAKGLVQVPGA